MQSSSQLASHTHISDTHQAQHQHQGHGQLQQQQQPQQRWLQQQPEQQQPDQNGVQEATEQQCAHSRMHHQQPTVSPFMQAQNGRSEWANGQQQQQEQPPVDGDSASLPGLGSAPVSLNQCQSGQHQPAGPSKGPALGQDQEQLPAGGQGTGSGVGEGGGSGSDEDETVMRAAGLELRAEEELQGLSRLEEDALEAKVASPIGQLSQLAFSLVARSLPSPPVPSRSPWSSH